MKVLITGGVGFIGSNFLHYMTGKYPDYEYICIDKLSYASNLKNIEDLISSNKVVFIKGDISDKNFISDLFRVNSFDLVVNFAAESHVDKSIMNPVEFIHSNYLGVFNLLEEIRVNPRIRFHQVSTDEVYGDLPLDRPDLLFTENSRFAPSSPYSATKAAADLLVMAYYRTYGLHVTVSHSTNNYGPFQYPEKLIPLTIHRAKLGLSIPIYGNGLNVRDWIHVADHCKAIDLIIHNAKPGRSFNLGANNELTNIEVVDVIIKIMNKSEDLKTFVDDRLGHDLRYAVDTSKIAEELKWYPSVSFLEGISLTVEWYLNNEDWLTTSHKTKI
jgi:dTDP-glucose 4,6-dehydratase